MSIKENEMVFDERTEIEQRGSAIVNEYEIDADEARRIIKGYTDITMRYSAAIKEITTKLEILDHEFSVSRDYNPIHHLQSRLKSLKSIMEKLERRGFEPRLESIYELHDVAGVRVVCNYLDDIYKFEESLLRQDDIKLIKRKDYIQNPKESGYRSLHLVVEVPIFLSDRTYHMPVEIQIRTVAMDTWASLEHELRYKSTREMPEQVAQELKDCARFMADLDHNMQRIHQML